MIRGKILVIGLLFCSLSNGYATTNSDWQTTTIEIRKEKPFSNGCPRTRQAVVTADIMDNVISVCTHHYTGAITVNITNEMGIIVASVNNVAIDQKTETQIAVSNIKGKYAIRIILDYSSYTGEFCM